MLRPNSPVSSLFGSGRSRPATHRRATTPDTLRKATASWSLTIYEAPRTNLSILASGVSCQKCSLRRKITSGASRQAKGRRGSEDTAGLQIGGHESVVRQITMETSGGMPRPPLPTSSLRQEPTSDWCAHAEQLPGRSNAARIQNWMSLGGTTDALPEIPISNRYHGTSLRREPATDSGIHQSHTDLLEAFSEPTINMAMA
jgi:hypothetical protein